MGKRAAVCFDDDPSGGSKVRVGGGSRTSECMACGPREWRPPTRTSASDFDGVAAPLSIVNSGLPRQASLAGQVSMVGEQRQWKTSGSALAPLWGVRGAFHVDVSDG